MYRLNVQVTAYGWQTIPDRRMVRLCDPLQNFEGTNHITGMAGLKVVKFCTKVGDINSSNRMTFHPHKWRGYGHVTCFKILPFAMMQRIVDSSVFYSCAAVDKISTDISRSLCDSRACFQLSLVPLGLIFNACHQFTWWICDRCDVVTFILYCWILQDSSDAVKVRWKTVLLLMHRKFPWKYVHERIFKIDLQWFNWFLCNYWSKECI